MKNDKTGDEYVKYFFVPKILRVFISYSNEDKLIAGKFKEIFSQAGIQTFLAHEEEDIIPGTEWENEIIKNIREADIIIALLSENFKQSKWTDQETGIAISNSKIIIPICLDKTLPYGFVKRFQAVKKFTYEITKGTFGKNIIICDDIFKVIEYISKLEKFNGSLKDSLITGLRNQRHYRDAEKHLELLVSMKPFSIEEINIIIKESIGNNQIHDANKCKVLLKDLIEKYEQAIDPENLKTIQNLIE